MRELLRSHSVSYVHGLRVALEAEGIETVLLDQYSVGFDSFAGRVRLMVQRDDDAERALQIIRAIDARAAARRPETGWRVQRWGCAAVVAGFVLMVAGLFALEDWAEGSGSSRILAYGLLGAAAAAGIGGVCLVIFAPRSDTSTID